MAMLACFLCVPRKLEIFLDQVWEKTVPFLLIKNSSCQHEIVSTMDQIAT